MSIAQRLVRRGLLLPQDLSAIHEAHSQNPSKPLHHLLLERGYVKEEDLYPALAEEFGMELVDLTHTKVSPEALTSVPLKLVHRRA